MSKDHNFNVSIETDAKSGEIKAVYVRVREGRAHRTVEKAEGAVFVDYNRSGKLLGVEMLAPCSIRVLDSIAREEPLTLRKRTRDFLRDAIPRKMVAAG